MCKLVRNSKVIESGKELMNLKSVDEHLKECKPNLEDTGKLFEHILEKKLQSEMEIKEEKEKELEVILG